MLGEKFTEIIGRVFLLLPASFTLAVLLLLLLWKPPMNTAILTSKGSGRAKFLLVSVLGSLLFGVIFEFVDAPAEYLFILSLTSLTAILLCLARRDRVSNLTLTKLNLLTLSDVAVLGFAFTLLLSWADALSHRKIICIETILFFPAAFATLCYYAIYNCSLFVPDKLKIATWRLLSYGYPEGAQHRKGSIGKRRQYGLSISDLVGWGLFLFFSFIGWLFGYWLAGNPFLTMLYISVILLSLVIFIFIKGIRFKAKSKAKEVFGNVIIGSGIVTGFAGFIDVVSGHALIGYATPEDRGLLAIVLCIPFALIFMQVIPQAPQVVSTRWSALLGKSQTIKSISAVSVAVRSSAFDRKTIIAIQSLLISAVFLLYFLIPKIGFAFKWVGMTEFLGRPIFSLLRYFEQISSTWTIPKPGEVESWTRFIFGNQGLVLLFFAWSMATIMAWVTIIGRLSNIPNLFKTKIGRFFSGFDLILFYAYFGPLLFFVILLVPVAGLYIFGFSFAVILGVFGFGLLLPRLLAIFLSMWYLLVVILKTNRCEHSVDINSAAFDELILLPGIGHKLARKIINGRPYTDIYELNKLKGIGLKFITELKELTRI